MKRILIVFIIIFVSGCSNVENNYLNLINDIKSQTKSSENIPFDIKISLDELHDLEMRYTVVIDNPSKIFTDVSALVIHDYELTDSFPSIGVIDDPLNLSNEKEDSFSKGIILVGYLPKGINDIEFKVMVQYRDGDKLNKVYFIENTTI